MKRETKADMALLFVAVCWGASNYVISLCMNNMSPLTVNMFRFGFGALTILLLGFNKLKNINKQTLKYALIMGFFLTLCYLFTNLGIERTSVSNSGFYCSLAVLFVPFGEWICFKRKPSKKLGFVIAISIVGVLLISLKGDFGFNPDTIKGDLLCLACSLSYTFNVLITDKAVKNKEVDAFALGFCQITVTMILSSAIAFSFTTPNMPSSFLELLGLLFLGAFCTGAAFVIQPIAQQYTTGTHVGLIYALEPVFCAIIAFIFAHEVLLVHNYIGKDRKSVV